MIIVIFILFALAWLCHGAGEKQRYLANHTLSCVNIEKCSDNTQRMLRQAEKQYRTSAGRLSRAAFAFCFCAATLTVLQLLK
ncbi:hypothetical protein SLP22_0065 [Salmonella phage BAU.Micro_SLP-22]|nr:hypothetical protein SLP22_00013 [Salmonella phage BAU.Micro_SLP-22]